jgi:hypothetical protein
MAIGGSRWPFLLGERVWVAVGYQLSAKSVELRSNGQPRTAVPTFGSHIWLNVSFTNIFSGGEGYEQCDQSGSGDTIGSTGV